MDNAFITAYLFVSLLLAVVDFYIAARSYQKTEEIGNYLGGIAFLAGVVNLSYLFSCLTENYLRASIASSIYFASIDWLLVILVHFVYLFTGMHLIRIGSILRMAIRTYAVFDTAVMAANIFTEIAVHYEQRNTVIAVYTYQMKPLYMMHLVFTYVLVLLVLGLLLWKIHNTPRLYCNQYLFIVAAILLVVLVNAVFLYPNDDSIYTLIDYSILGYSVGLILMYWACFDYRHHYMLKALSMTVFQNIDQGIVLFDHMNELIMYNERAKNLLPSANYHEKMTLNEFADFCLIAKETRKEENYSIQCDRKGHQGQPLRCDFRRLRDRRGRVIGNLFVFTDISNDTDLLTGFQHWENFRKFAVENPYHFVHPTSAVVFDIVGLSEINRTFGREVGDQRIRNLAKIIRSQMPKETYFVRGHEAHLVAVCRHKGENEIRDNVDRIIMASGGTVMYGMSSTQNLPGSMLNHDEKGSWQDKLLMEKGQSVITAIETASRTLQTKKLLSVNSAHSQTITSLVTALQESDSDTEAHVQRTQKMGAALGRKIGLDDTQLADLNLLCLLHDIGKIGIPLEILNKPGQLTDPEWVMLRTHAEKGYQIALSSEELKPIARMILYHHERWDGMGYPEKLAGNQIPILSRIISIVDAYDAMVNDRAYRKGMSPEKAQEEIRRCSGSQFDPSLAEEFLTMLKENPDIAGGEKTGAGEAPVYHAAFIQEGVKGETSAVLYSRYLLDLENTIIEVDSQFEKLTGYRPEEALGKLNQVDLIPAPERPYYLLQVNNQFSKGSIAFLAHKIQKKDGSQLEVLCFGKRFYDSAAKAYRSEILITESKSLL